MVKNQKKGLLKRLTRRKRKNTIHPSHTASEHFKKGLDSIYLSDYEKVNAIDENILQLYRDSFHKKTNNDLKKAYSLIYSYAKKEKNKIDKTRYLYLLEGIHEGSVNGTKLSVPKPLSKLPKTLKKPKK